MSVDVLYRIRGSRADPPGFASDDGLRRRVYGAALAQFDELISAAKATGPASRPLPLFYALSQAGRAIAAAHAGGAWRLRGHGLSAPELDVRSILGVEVRRSARGRGGDDVAGGCVDSVTGVASATSAEFYAGGARIGALWRSLPELCGLSPAAADANPGPLALVCEEVEEANLPAVMRMQLDPDHLYGVVVGFQGSGQELESRLSEFYPTAAGARLYRPPGQDWVRAHHTRYGSGFLVRWQADSPDAQGLARTLNRVAPPAGGPLLEQRWWRAPSLEGFEPRWLRPGIDGVAVSPLLTWWALLFGLSMLARYEPATWMAALDYEDSKLAAALGRLLEIGCDRVPQMVLEALRPRLHGSPAQ